MSIEALSIKEPWISRIVSGEKTIEMRSWRTNHRGPLRLVGSRTPSGPFSGLAERIDLEEEAFSLRHQYGF